MAAPYFGGGIPAWDSPGQELFAVTPSDSVDIVSGGFVRALYVGVTGNIAIVAVGQSSPVTLSNVPVGILPIAASRVYATGTTATSIVGLR